MEAVFLPAFQVGAPLAEVEYGGWFANLWTREGRAKNKIARAKRKRARGRHKAAARLEMRAGVLKAKAKGKVSLGPDSKFKKLWHEKYPYARRKRRMGAGLTGTARGYRPAWSQIVSEQRAVILGGLLALQSAGIEGFDKVDIDALPKNMKQRQGKDRDLRRAVQKVTGNKKIRTLKAASEKIRRLVVKHGLERVAWPGRALMMLGASSKRSALTNASAAAVSTGTAVAASALAGASIAPPWVQAIATAPAAGILGIVSLTSGAVGVGAGVKGARAKSLSAQYEQKFTANLERWAAANNRMAAAQELARAKLATEYQQELARKVGEVRGQELTAAFQVIAVAGGISLAALAVGYAIRRIRSPE